MEGNGDALAAGDRVRTVCAYCGVGCGMVLEIGAGPGGRRVVTNASGDREHPANRGRLCTKGATTADMLAAPGRLTSALLRADRGAALQPAALDTAIEHTARRFRQIIDEHGPDAVALYVSGQMSLEAQYLANKLAKGYIRTNQIESNSRLCMASAATGYKLSLGADGPPGSYDDFDRADVFLVVGSNMADCHPVLFLRMLERVKAGARLIVVDPRRTATAAKADLFLQIRPGTDLSLLNGLLHLLVANGHIDHEFIAAHTEGWEAMPAFLADYPPAVVAELTGLAEADLRTAARWIGEAAEWTSCWTMGLNQSTHGTWNTNALVNLHLATGAICRPGSGPFSLTGQPNAMGGREMGYLGPGLPGQRSVSVPEDRAFIEELWGLPSGTIRADGVGRGTVELFERLAEGEIKACWIICTNPIASVANRSTVIEGLERAEFVVTQDVFAETETNAYADVVLPAAMWTETQGVLVNSERMLTLAQPAVPPPGDATADWLLIARVARAMGYAGFDYASAEEIFEEITRAHNPQTGYDLRGASYPRLRETPVQWPAAPDGPARNPIRYAAADGSGPRFPTPSGRAVFFPRPHMPPRELPDDKFPFLLSTGRLQHQWHTLTKTGKVDKLNKLNPGPFVELNPQDADALGIAAGDAVEVASRRGRALLPAVVTDRVVPGCCFAPFHWNDLFGERLSINAVTNDAVDPLSFQPEFKACAVSLTKVAAAVIPVKAGSDDAAGEAGHEDSAAGGIAVLWASQTGNAEGFAATAAKRLTAAGHRTTLLGMDDADPAALPASDVLLITSTFGDGDAPDNGSAFWEALVGTTAPLAHVRYAVLAFGDSSYDDFCGHGRRLDLRFEGLGATRLTPRTDCEPDFETDADAWLEQVLTTLSAPVTTAGPDASAASRPVSASVSVRERPANPRTPPPSPPPSSSLESSDRPAGLARLTGNRLLSLPGASKEVRQFTFDLDDSPVPIIYEAGDALSVRPVNARELVDEWLELTGLDAHASVDIAGVGVVPFGDALRHHLDITRISPELLRFLAQRTENRHLLNLLRPGNKGELAQWCWGRQAADALAEHCVRATAQEWAGVLKRLRDRQYSISSSPRVDRGRLSLTVSVVRYEGSRGRRRNGLCSAFLADAPAGAEVPVQVRPSPHFRPPADPAAPMIMVGPGTGVAPFIGFLHDRRARGHTGENWLLFGEQHRATDFYYREEINAFQQGGTLTRLDTAFSRDQRAKIYVQDRMREHGYRLWRWLDEAGAYFFVCGDASRMAKDVDAALREIIVTHGDMSDEAAAAYIKRLSTQKRYVRDVY